MTYTLPQQPGKYVAGQLKGPPLLNCPSGFVPLEQTLVSLALGIYLLECPARESRQRFAPLVTGLAHTLGNRSQAGCS